MGVLSSVIMYATFSRIALGILALSFTGAVAEDKKLTAKEAKAKYDAADKALNAAWAEAKKVLLEPEFNALKEDQRAWVEHRDYLARSPMYTGAETQDELPLTAPEYLEAAADLTDIRTEWLKGLVKDPDGVMTGVWTDSYGGHVEIMEGEGKLHFIVECVRGPTSHLGGLAGIAEWNSPIGWFSDKGRDETKTDVTNLSFVMDGRKLKVVGANTGAYHGARAYFDGEYVKVRPLSGKDQAKVMKASKSGELPEE